MREARDEKGPETPRERLDHRFAFGVLDREPTEISRRRKLPHQPVALVRKKGSQEHRQRNHTWPRLLNSCEKPVPIAIVDSWWGNI